MVAMLGLGACATTPPSPEEQALRDSPTVLDVQRSPESFLGRRVRWGGSVIGVENREDVTVVELLSRPLLPSTRPDTTARAQGRFLARIQGFVDPEELPRGKWLTLVGTLEGVEKKRLGDYLYVFPVMKVERKTMWRDAAFYDRPLRSYPYPYPHRDPFYDPFYDPYYDPFMHPLWPHSRFRQWPYSW